jgi:hypothetical protein
MHPGETRSICSKQISDALELYVEMFLRVFPLLINALLKQLSPFGHAVSSPVEYRQKRQPSVYDPLRFAIRPVSALSEHLHSLRGRDA